MQPQFWRGVLLSQAAIVFLMTAAIIVRYTTKIFREQRNRVLPIHIVTISLSYLLATVFIALEIYQRWDLPVLTYRTPLAGAIFVLGDTGLVFMLVHIAIQRKYLEHIREHVSAKVELEKRELAAELKEQTGSIEAAIHEVGQKADRAYHTANNVNEKIATLQKGMADRETIDDIDQTGKDTNARVRRMEPQSLPKNETQT